MSNRNTSRYVVVVDGKLEINTGDIITAMDGVDHYRSLGHRAELQVFSYRILEY